MSETNKGFLETLKEVSDGKLVICFAGVGSAFAKKNAQTSMIVAKNGKTILVDCGTTIPTELSRKGINIWDFDYYHFTHSHADHVGGAEEIMLMHRYVAKRKPKVIITQPYYKILWDDSLRGGCENNEDGLLKFCDLVEPVQPSWMQEEPREIYKINVDGIELVIFRTAHIPGGVEIWEKAFWSTGLMVDGKVLYSGDTRFDGSLFEHLPVKNVSAIFHDCQLFSPGIVHADYESLKILDPSIKAKMRLVHYGDNFEQFKPENDGFAGFAKAWEFYVVG